MSLSDKSAKTQKVKVLPMAGADPEANKNEMIKVILCIVKEMSSTCQLVMKCYLYYHQLMFNEMVSFVTFERLHFVSPLPEVYF